MKNTQTHYEEYYINETNMKKLYNMYIHQSIFDKILDILVLIAIIFTIMSLVLEFLIGVSETVLIMIHSFSIFVLAIFATELIRNYFKAKTTKEFIKHHWIDLILVVFLSLFFVFAYFGFAKIRGISSIKSYFQNAKEARIAAEIFNK